MMDNAASEMNDAPDYPTADDGPDLATPTLKRWLIPVLVAVAVIALVVIALLRGQIQFDPTSPEGAVQEYLQAIVDKRWEDALAVLDPQAFETCGPEHISSHVWDQEFTASHVGTNYGSTFTFVEVQFEYRDGGPWGGGGWWEQFTLFEENGLWYITDDPWPNFRFSCSRFG